MKRNKSNTKADALTASQTVHIEFDHATATTISIAGTFNDWRPGVTPMVALAEGRWFKELVLEPGIYEYCLVVDGEWMPDPRANDTVPNPFGGMNSILNVNGCSR